MDDIARYKTTGYDCGMEPAKGGGWVSYGDHLAALSAAAQPVLAVTDAMVEKALHARVPGGSEVWHWLPQLDGWTPHETAKDVMRCALEAVFPTPRAGESETPWQKPGQQSRTKGTPTDEQSGETSHGAGEREPVAEFAKAILHGDDEHRAWLMEAAEAFIAGGPLPPPRGKGTATPPSPAQGTVERLRVGDYPIGTKVHSIHGSHWTRTAAGWQASGGDTFPRYGADAYEVELPASPAQGAEPVAVPPLERYPYLNPREFLLLCSYCGDDTEGCSDTRPCAECLAMCNVFDEDGKYLRQLGQFASPPAQGAVERAEPVEALADFLCNEFDFDLDPVVGASWPIHPKDDGYRGDNACVRLQPPDVQARARDNAKRILAFVASFASPPVDGDAVKAMRDARDYIKRGYVSGWGGDVLAQIEAALSSRGSRSDDR